MQRTTTDPGSAKWLVDDVPFRIRQWGTDDVREFPKDRVETIVGRDPSCGIRLPGNLVSKHHAQLAFLDEHWRLRDLGAKNGLIVNGAPCDEVVLEPGFVVEIGGVVWIVESTRLVALRSFLARLVGYGVERLADVDQVLRKVRNAALRQHPLVLNGDRDLVPVARAIHRRVIGADRPFIVCDPRRGQGPATVRSAENYQLALPAMEAAIGGSLCVRKDRLPRDFDLVRMAHREPNPRFQLIICEHGDADADPQEVAPVVIPSLRNREDEIDTIITEYATDARELFGITYVLDPSDRAWIARNSSESHAALEKGAERVTVARSTDGNIAAAAAMLRMSHTSLMRWFEERKPLAGISGARRDHDGNGGST